MKGLKNEVICQNNDIQRYLPFEPLTYKEAIIRAMNREEQDQIYTHWSNAYPPAHELALKLHELKSGPKYSSTYSLVTPKDAASLFQCLCRVGGKEGWFSSNWLWWLRGTIDKILLGVGTSRGRRSQTSLEINDVLDFWRANKGDVVEHLHFLIELPPFRRAWSKLLLVIPPCVE